MKFKVGDRVMEFGNKMAPSANGQKGTVVSVGEKASSGFRDIRVSMDDLIIEVVKPENRLRLIKPYEPLHEGDRVEFIGGDNAEVGTVDEMHLGIIIGEAVAHVTFDNGGSIAGMEYDFAKIEEEEGFFVGDYVMYADESDSVFYKRKGTIVGFGELYSEEDGRSVVVRMDDNKRDATVMESEIIKVDKKTGSRFVEGDEVVVSDPEMRCYGEHGIVESVQAMNEFGSTPVLLVKLLDPVEYLVYGEDCFQSLEVFYADSDEEDDEDIIGVGDTVVIDQVDHEHAGKRGKVTNVGYYDGEGVEHIQVELFFDGQVVIEPWHAFTLLTDDDLILMNQMLMSFQDPDEDSDEEEEEGKFFDELVGALESLVEQVEVEEEETNFVQIMFRDGVGVTTSIKAVGDVREQLMDKLIDLDATIAIGDIVTHVNDIKYVRILDEELSLTKPN